MKKYLRILIIFNFIMMVAFTCQAASVVLEDNTNYVVPSGNLITIYGTDGPNMLTLKPGAKAQLYNFPGSNTITVQTDSTLFKVSRSGASVTFNGSDGTFFQIPATATAQSICFNDISLNLVVENNQVKLGDQVIVLTEASIAVTSGSSPMANAGDDAIVNKYTLVVLNASASNYATAYKWTQTEGPTVNLSNDTSVTAFFTPVSSATYKFTLTVTNGENSDTDEVIVTVQDIPTISISSPTSDDTISVTQSSIEISGAAGQNISSVVLTNNANGMTFTGQLPGDGTFSVQGVSLVQGDNLLEVVALDNTGAQTQDSLLVTYSQNVNFLSAPVFSVNSAFVNESVETVVSIALQDNQNIASDGVLFVPVGENGVPATDSVAVLHDDGDVANGDDIAGDGVFSSKMTINKPQAGEYYYRVAVNTGSMDYSSSVIFTVLIPLTDQDVQLAENKTEEAFDKAFPAAGTKFTESEFDIYKNEALNEFLSSDDVQKAEFSADGNSIVVEYASGLVHSIDFVYEGTKGGARTPSTVSEKISQPQIKYYAEMSSSPGPLYTTSAKMKSFSTTGSTTTGGNSVGSYRAMALSPFKWQFDPWDDIDAAYVEVQNSTSPVFTAETPILNYDVTVEHFKNLSNYGVIVISSHGGLEGSNPVIYTGEEATSTKQKTYQKDISAKRLIVSHMITILVEDGGWFWFDSEEKKKVFKIAPSFITNYNKNLPNTLVYMSICQGASTDALANAFISAGAGAFIGYTDVVNASYAFNAGKTFFKSMIAGKKVKDAVKDATDAHGVNDGDNTPAAFVYKGNGDLVLEQVGLQNGSFEENLKYWQQNGGDIRILSKLSSLSPNDGSYMAILSSGLGSVNDSEAIISQQFKIPEGIQTLSFYYDVISEEPMEFVGSIYDDKYRAVLIDQNGTEIELAYETVNTSSWTAIGGSQPDGGMFDGGDATTYHTGWKNVTHPVASLAGQTVTLKFRVWDVGDSVYDTAALLDNIILQ